MTPKQKRVRIAASSALHCGKTSQGMYQPLFSEANAVALRCDMPLARRHTPQRRAPLHCAPIQAPVEGEPEAIHASLGSSRLGEPRSRYPVTAAFHGHADHGSPEGRTREGVPV